MIQHYDVIRKSRCQRGISVVESLVALGVVAITALSLGYIYTRTIKSVAVVDTSRDTLYVHSGVLAKMRQILLDVKDPASGKNTLGLCRLMTTDALGYGIGEIKVDFATKKVQAAFRDSATGPDRWAASLGAEWTPLTGELCPGENEFKRCFIPSKSFEQDGAFKGVSDIRLSAEIVPVDLSPENARAFSPIQNFRDRTGANAIDAKRVAFFLESEISYKKKDDQGQEQTFTNNNREVVWAADVNSCYYRTAAGEYIDMYPSGVGLGDSEGRVLFNNPDFFKNVVQDPLKDSGFKRIVVQEGLVDPSGFIRTDSQKNVEVACTEAVYRCFNKNQKRSFSARVNSDLDIVYTNGYKGANHAFVNMTPRFQIQKDRSGSDLMATEGVEYDFLLAGRLFGRHSDGKYYEIEEADQKVNLKKPMRLQATTNVLNVEARDSNGGMCARICPSTPSRQTPPAHFAKLDVTLHSLYKNAATGKVEDYSATLSSTAPVGCIVCYAKNCNRLGLATFGRMDQQPDEPIDSGLPECALNDGVQKEVSLAIPTIPSGQGNKCLAAQIVKGTTELKYVLKDCTESLPTLCYGYGRFSIATDVGASQAAWAKHTFHGAQRRCYEMGQETVLQEKLREMFLQAPSTFDPSGLVSTTINGQNFFRFLNNSAQGIFLAPQSNRQQVATIETLLGKVSFPTETLFWVALQTDDKGYPVATVPVMQTKDNEGERVALFFEGNIPRLETFDGGQFRSRFVPSAGGTSFAILSHHIRFKGVVPAARYANEQMAFLCRDREGDGFFKSSGRSRDFMDGYDICRHEDGFFVPPLTPMQWVKAFELAAPFAPDYSFPDPESAAGLLWVGAASTDGFKTMFIPTSVKDVPDNKSPFSRLWDLYNGNKTPNVNARGQFRADKEDFKVEECRYEKIKKSKEVESKDSSGNTITQIVDDWVTERICDWSTKNRVKRADYRICHNTDGSRFIRIDYKENCSSRGMTQLDRDTLEKSLVAQSWWLVLTRDMRVDRYQSDNDQTVELL